MKSVAVVQPWAPVINSWHDRADAYRQLTKRWALLPALADRLVTHLPDDFAGTFADLGGGAGLVASRALAAFPRSKCLFLEPADRMLELAKAELAPFGDRVRYDDVALAELGPPHTFDCAVSSATMHLAREESVMRLVAMCMPKGGIFAYNVWGHSYVEGAYAPDPTGQVRAAIDQSLREMGRDAPPWRNGPTPRLRSKADLVKWAEAAGYEVLHFGVDVDPTPVAFYVEFTAMSPGFLGRMPTDLRRSVIARAEELASGTIDVTSVRVVVRRR